MIVIVNLRQNKIALAMKVVNLNTFPSICILFYSMIKQAIIQIVFLSVFTRTKDNLSLSRLLVLFK